MKFAIGLKYVPRLLGRPKCRPELDGAYRMQAELERGDNTEISATTSHRPKQILVLPYICGDESPIRENHVHRKKIVDGQSIAAAQVTDTASQR